MFDYSVQIDAFRDKRVRLSTSFKDKLMAHRKANRDRLIGRLPTYIKRARISDSSFYPQGSVAMSTIIQTKFADEEYDIDDGLVISASQLIKDNGEEMSSEEVREAVRTALKDKRFSRQPKLYSNCVRVFYADEDEEKHHVDFPAYRRRNGENGDAIRELASEVGWIESDPTQVNSWFNDIVKTRNKEVDGWGTQFRQLVVLLKRFCRSRKDWLDLLPNGMKLTMLVAECQPNYDLRIDLAFRNLFANMERRLAKSLAIHNLAHPYKPMITRTASDSNVKELRVKISDAMKEIRTLDLEENNNIGAARKIWDLMFKSDGFFAEFDAANDQQKAGALVDPSFFKVPWCDPPIWPVKQTPYSVSLTAKYGNSEHGSTWYSFQSNCKPLSKHLYLRFQGNTTVPKPFQVHWQVVNTGSEAINSGSLRGEIIAAGSTGAGGLQSTTAPDPLRRERTLYKGTHWVECFIVKDGCCVARSGPFIVKVK